MKLPQKVGAISCILLFFIVNMLSAFDYGLELTNTGGVQYVTEPNYYTDHKGVLWISIPFNASNSLAIEGGAYAAKPVSSDAFVFFADLDLFRLSLTPYASASTKITIDAGRIPVGDVTGFVLNQSADGAVLHGAFPFGNIDLFGGYTGLLNVRKGGAMMTDDDSLDADTEEIYAFGSKRVIAKLTLQLPQAIGTMDLIVEALGQYDLRTDATETVHTAYGTISASGPLARMLYYSISGTYQTGVLESDKSYSENSAIGSVRFDFFPIKNNQIFAQFVYSPGENDFFSGFLPITFQGAGTLYSEGYANLMRASAGWYFNPISALNIDIGAKVFMHPKETETAKFYDNTEASLGATIKVTSDLRFRLDSVIKIPSEGDKQYQASLKAILDI